MCLALGAVAAPTLPAGNFGFLAAAAAPAPAFSGFLLSGFLFVLGLFLPAKFFATSSALVAAAPATPAPDAFASRSCLFTCLLISLLAFLAALEFALTVVALPSIPATKSPLGVLIVPPGLADVTLPACSAAFFALCASLKAFMPALL